MRASIIVPVYNGSKTLPYCLDSILNQTLKDDIEIILINDGSTDNSLELLLSYKSKYPQQIRVITQTNKGIAQTRNRGIEESNGTYLFFIDDDDFIDKDYIQAFITAIEDTEADMVIGGYERIDVNNNKILFRRDATDHPWVKYMILSPWARIYRKEALIKNNLKFLDFNVGEDIYMNILANLKLKVKTIKYNGYKWVYNKSSVSNSNQKGLKKTINFLPLLDKIYIETKEIKITREEFSYLEFFFLKTCIHYLLHSGKGVEYGRLKESKNEIFNWLIKHYPTYKKNPNISLIKPRGEAFLTRLIIYLYVLLQKLHLENVFLWVYSKL